uniref:Uncharacterized protein n=1 Tax=Anguilla anguilla TaxID=7936 RepID=A0A0E9QUL5_ANGAN
MACSNGWCFNCLVRNASQPTSHTLDHYSTDIFISYSSQITQFHRGSIINPKPRIEL